VRYRRDSGCVTFGAAAVHAGLARGAGGHCGAPDTRQRGACCTCAFSMSEHVLAVAAVVRCGFNRQ